MDSLRDVFPDLSEELLSLALEKESGNVENAVVALTDEYTLNLYRELLENPVQQSDDFTNEVQDSSQNNRKTKNTVQ